ncbi:MAG TPA: adenylyltransferase/cytidyltransferase family protein [Patescibacteria group bacterium]|nr:adenylyltransferase/cytidyltransferase family protein [Patescibacteria group bacterium]
MNGFLLINKPAGPTSHDIVNQLRRITGIRQIGHAGTLDPFADGLLIVAVEASTKLLKYFVGLDKHYRATLFLGATSDTQDRTGVVTPAPLQGGGEGEVWEHSSYRPLTPSYLRRGDTTTPSTPSPFKGEGEGEVFKNIEMISKSLSRFLGSQLQTPPMYSAKKIHGKKLYELARQGKTVERKPHEIEVYSINLISYNWPYVTIDVHCSSGTYIRTLGHDIGQALGCGAYLESLTRTAIGDFESKDALSLADTPLHPLSPSQRQDTAREDMPPSLPSPFEGEGKGEVFKKTIILSPHTNSTIMVFGVFDLLHKGHEYFFQQAKKFGSQLIVVITTDNNVTKQKKYPPTYTQQERLQHIKALKCVNDAHIGDETDYFALIKKYSPDLICLGYDQAYSETQLRQELKERELKTHVLRLDAYKSEIYKSHLLKQ